MSQSQKSPNATHPIIKVCGVTCHQELYFIAAAGVDTIGINLVPISKRYVDLKTAVGLCEAAKQVGLRTTAILRNPTAEQLHEVHAAGCWDFIQLHGSEAPELVSTCRPINLIKAVSWSGLKEEAVLVQRWIDWETSLSIGHSVGSDESGMQRLVCFLVDTYAPDVGGGTGKTADWGLLYPRPATFQGRKVILAGGLTADNVLLAIRTTRCSGVDTASGVETSPGRKSKRLVAEFANEAKKGFSEGGGWPLQ